MTDPRKALAMLIVILTVGLGGWVGIGSFPDDPDVDCDELRREDQRASREVFAADLQNQLTADEALFRDALDRLAVEQATANVKIESLNQEAENLSDNGRASNELDRAWADLRVKSEAVNTARENLENAKREDQPEADPPTNQELGDVLNGAIDAENAAKDAVAAAVGVVANLSLPAQADEADEGEDGEAKVAASKSLEGEIEDLEDGLETMKTEVRDQFMKVDAKRRRLEDLFDEMKSYSEIRKLESSRIDLVKEQFQVLPTDALSKINEELASLRTKVNQDEDAIRSKDRERVATERRQAANWPQASVFTPRSSIALQPSTPVVSIKFGPHRSPQRIEVPFESSASAAAEQGLVSQGNPEVVDDLPEKATFLAEPGTLRSDGSEISPDRIEVWARRLGPNLLMSICVSPPKGLPAGTYTGDVFLLDPSLNPVRVPVEVTTQFQWINLLYFLLPTVPFMATLYVWYTGRIAAGLKPSPREALIDWLKLNLVPLLGVGFASVWATMQVAFTNPTWGSTVYGAAAVVGASLVASVTAITAVAGSVVGTHIREKEDVARQRQEKERQKERDEAKQAHRRRQGEAVAEVDASAGQ